MSKKSTESASKQKIRRHFKSLTSLKKEYECCDTGISFEHLFSMKIADLDFLIRYAKKIRTAQVKHNGIITGDHTESEKKFLSKYQSKFEKTYPLVKLSNNSDSDPEFANEPPSDDDVPDCKDIVQDVPGKEKMTQEHFNRQVQYFEQHHPAGLEAFKANAIIVNEMPSTAYDRAAACESIKKAKTKSLKQPTRKFDSENVDQLNPVIIDEDIERKIYQAARRRQMEQYANPVPVNPQSQQTWDELKAEAKCEAYKAAKKAYAQARKDGIAESMVNPTKDESIKPTNLERKLYNDMIKRREKEAKRKRNLEAIAKREQKAR